MISAQMMGSLWSDKEFIGLEPARPACKVE
jgi:hypothetical protein